MAVRLKVCCIASRAEAATAIAAGASALGLVSAMPSGPGPIAEGLIVDIARAVPPPVATFLLTCETAFDAIADQARRTGVNTLQLVDAVDPAVHERLRAALPAVRLVQVIHVTGLDAVAEALETAPRVDALLLDSGNPALAVKELGGTGRRHDWTVSAEIVRRAARPVFLAGGIGPGNVAEAIAAVRPFGIDLCTGVRTGGRLDPAKLAALAAAMGIG